LIEVGPGHGLSRIVATQSTAPAIGIDAGGTAFAGLLLAAGAAFVLGAPVRADGLFEERFVRPFDLDRPRRFLTNPCEAAPLDTAARRRSEPAAAKPIGPVTPSMAGSSPLEALRAVLARRLQMDAATIEPRQRLLGDLHLNSIAVGHIVGETARVLGLAPPAAPTDFAVASVGEIAEALSASAALPAAPEEAFPAGVGSWVRCFVPDLVPRALDGPVRALPPAWRIHAPDGHKLAGRLAALAAPSGRASGGAMICLRDNPGPADLGLLLDGAQAALSGDGDAPVLVLQQDGGGAAFARCLSLEHPRLRVCVIDLPFAHGDAVAWVAAEAARVIPGYREVHYDTDGTRRVPVLRLLDSPPSPACELGPDDVVLVSGGAKGISAECALALARQTGARLGLLGRSPAAAAEVAATMHRLHAAGITAGYAEADVTDRQAVACAVAQLVQDLGPITAVLHGAGVNWPTPLARLTPEVVDATVAVKVDGLRHILAALDPDRLRLLIGFSSVIARAGLPGEAHYAVANEWLCRLIAAYCARHSTCRPLVLEWSVWSGVGMGETLGAVATLSRQGVVPLPIEAARSVFASLVAAPPAAQPVVVAGRFGAPPTIEFAGPPVPPGRFLERLAVHYPGVELVAEADLRPATDPYLAEHAVAGTELFPAVLGLEAMAQAASALAGERPRRLEQIVFHRPIALQADGGTVRIAALRHPDDRIETIIRDGAAQFQADSMSATAWTTGGNAPTAPADGAVCGPLPLGPEDFYGRLLFHQGRFRRITAYHRLSATSCIARIGPADDGRWFPARAADDLVLGDPGARDAALHALQACIPHRRVLPVAARRIRLGCLRPDRDYLVQGRETARDGDRFRFDLEICEVGGQVVEWWEGLELKAVESLEAPPDWPVPLLGPLLERRLDELMPGRDIRVAVAGAAEGAPPDSAALLATLLPAGDKLSRRPDGRPEAGAAVSASHAGALTLAATAAGAVGCDIEAIVQRPEPAWRDLLGAERFALAQLIVEAAGEPLGCSATRVWSAIEALKKAGASVSQTPLTLVRCEADWIVLAAGSFGVVSWHAAVGPARCAIAIACQTMGIPEVRETRQPVYSYRHVVGFQDTNMVGNVYFVNHLEWQGRCREMFLRDKAPSVMEELGRGLSLATTHASCDYLEELRAFDEVEIDMRLVALNDSRMTLGFEYWRCPRDGRPVAVGQQELVWLREVGGRKIPASVPAEFLQALRPYVPGQS
ncbi:MAG TPA: SDR family NAD(P)-dependent oxidoreductase, partial [Acetobacteraceae bacterium]|nr:SDR family NAD(P)-dependent oxidoreductase [Acetobacteraceae bacterium]